ncbi:MAG: sel1 repeat family protein [Methanomassiliicoccaceae archaeon]|nr:sel1 repeat family protein [Methanomassiliicoccaceae archaeon]
MTFRTDGKERPGTPDEDEKDASEYRRELISGAEEGDAAAVYELGLAYQKGDGVPKDDKKAAELFRLVAEEADDDFIRFCLNTLRLIGSCEDGADHERAAELYRSVAEMGLWDMGLGPRCEMDEKMWFRLAAMNGDVFAQRNLGFIYLDISPPDHEESAVWMRMAAENGDVMAQNGLGYLYENGLGVPQDHYEAARWYFMAAEKGHRGAMEAFERMYNEGLIVLRDDADRKE